MSWNAKKYRKKIYTCPSLIIENEDYSEGISTIDFGDDKLGPFISPATKDQHKNTIKYIKHLNEKGEFVFWRLRHSKEFIFVHGDSLIYKFSKLDFDEYMVKWNEYYHSELKKCLEKKSNTILKHFGDWINNRIDTIGIGVITNQINISK